MEVVVGGEVDPTLGWVVDFAAVTKAWQPLHDQLDHRYLNDIKGLENPTSEVLAKWIYDRIRVQGAKVVSVSVSETCTASVQFTPDP